MAPTRGSALLEVLAATALVGVVMAAMLPSLAQLQLQARRAEQASAQWLGQTRALGWIQNQVRHAQWLELSNNRLTLWLAPGAVADCFGDPVNGATAWRNTFEVRRNNLRCSSNRRWGAQPALDHVARWQLHAVAQTRAGWRVLNAEAAAAAPARTLRAVQVCLMAQATTPCQTGINQQWMSPQVPHNAG
jgi:type II secretory pathway pseudopilin PulG